MTPREAAQAAGQTTYDPGVSCRHGHSSNRYTSSGGCITCTKEGGARRKAEKRAALQAARAARPSRKRKARTTLKPLTAEDFRMDRDRRRSDRELHILWKLHKLYESGAADSRASDVAYLLHDARMMYREEFEASQA